MTREEKIKIVIEKGYSYDEITGKIYSRFGREIKGKTNGYIIIGFTFNKKHYNIRGHQFAFYYKYKKIVEQIDHKDGNRSNNRICNLREVTYQQNHHNRTTAKGYSFHKRKNKFQSRIKLNGKNIYLGYFNTEEEAHQVYLDAKKIYHII